MEDVSYILCFTRKRDIFEVPLLIVFRNLGPYSIGYLKVNDRLLLAHFYLTGYQQERCLS